MFHLFESFDGHSGDIKGIAETETSLVTCSRDCSVKFWQLDKSYFHEGYVNSLAANGLFVASGSADKTVRVSHNGEQVGFLLGHKDNVCSLDFCDDLILSGSWDSTIKLWKDYQCILTIQGHKMAVWDVKFVQKSILSASADKTIKLWDMNGKLLVTFIGHTDVVRALDIIPQVGFVSCSNDATLRIWSLSGECLKVIHGHTSFIYTVTVMITGEILSAGEDRAVKVWNINGDCLQSIPMPCSSIWVVRGLKNGDFAVGGSDAVLRIFSKDNDRIASASILKSFEEALANLAIPKEQIGDLNLDKVESMEALNTPGVKEGQVKMVKGRDGVDAYQWSATNQQWLKIGSVVDAIGSNRKQLYDGKEYDYVFDVDITEGAPPIKLPYNVTRTVLKYVNDPENPYEAAQEFIHKYELPQDYLDQIANFILNNTKGVSLGVSSNANIGDPFTGGTRYIPQDASSSNHSDLERTETSYAVFKSGNLESVKIKIMAFCKEFSNSEHSLDASELGSLTDLIEDLKRRTCRINDLQITLLKKITRSWPVENRFPGLDLLSDIAGISASAATSILTLDNLIEDIKLTENMSRMEQVITMFKFRCLSNIISHKESRKEISARLDKIFNILDSLENLPNGNKNLAVAIATLYQNLSIFLKENISPRYDGMLLGCIRILNLCDDEEFKSRILCTLQNMLMFLTNNAETKIQIKVELTHLRQGVTSSSLLNHIDKVLSLIT